MTDETAVVTQEQHDAAVLERVMIAGDLSKLEPNHRVLYYREVCKSLGLNPLTKPFQYIVLNGKLTLYATRTATDQLRALRGVSIDRIDQEEMAGLYTATVFGHDKTGRADSEVGVVDLANLKGEKRANGIMKAVTKAKRRLTLSLAGLGWLDETEVGTAQPIEVDGDTGEVQEPKTLQQQVAAKREAVTTSGATAPDAEADATTTADEPPHPAGARADIQVGASTGSTDSGTPSGEPMPATEVAGTPLPVTSDAPIVEGTVTVTRRCEGFSTEFGACIRDAGHEANHQAKSKESWA